MNIIDLNQKVGLMESLQLEGLECHHYRGKADFQKLSDLINRCREADGLEEYHSAEELEVMYSHLNNCDLSRDFLMVEVNGKPVAYHRVFWWIDSRSGDYIYSIIWTIDPIWRQSELGIVLFHLGEMRLREIAKDHPSEVKKHFDTGCWDTQKEFSIIVENAGFQPIRVHYSMERKNLDNIPIISLPEGLEVHVALPTQYRQVWEASVEAFRDHWGFSEPTEEDYQAWVGSPQFNPSLWQVAWDGDQVAGMVLNYIDEKENERFGKMRGWTENICVRRPYRKRGVAKALIARSLWMLKDMGYQGARLGVDAQNLSGALQLYQSMGYEVVRSMTIFRKSIE